MLDAPFADSDRLGRHGAPDLTLGLRDVAAAIVDTIEPVESTLASGE